MFLKAWRRDRLIQIAFAIALASSIGVLGAAEPTVAIGVAQVDITPEYPVRLSGFGGRRTESDGVTQRIRAKAMSWADASEGPAILITADNLCVPDEMTQEVARRLARKIGLKAERLAITATHTHTAPMLKNVCPTLFGAPIPAEHQAHIDRYTGEFVDYLEQVALAAAKDTRPSRLTWGIGTVGFAVNRRTKGGPVDHDLPVLVVRDLDGNVRAVYFNYACHCVTLSNNKISGDWAGFAQQAIERAFPGALALASVGCGADSNPDSGVAGDNTSVCAKQGEQIADEIKRLIGGPLTPINDKPTVRYARIDLPLDTPRTRAEWEERAKRDDAVGYHARVNLARLDRGEILPAKLNYPIQTWLFGDKLALVFLPGETVVDYSLRLKRQFDGSRLWVNGYANEARAYIPSERVLKEGGYEGGDAMIYYDVPQRFAAGLEQRIIDAVSAQIPDSFVAPTGTEGTRPLSPNESLRAIRTKPGLNIELVAAEPLVVDPVAIDWSADGRLWVVEMRDYPMGMDGQWKPGGRVKVLEDGDGDGKYDKAAVFLEDLPFPTGVTAWNKGVLVCAAPDIIYAEDTNGDGKADVVKKLFTGFATDNYQARVNSLSLGLDNWIYGANGLIGGVIHGIAGGREVNIRGRDFRLRPDAGEFEPASGLTQQGRVRDDWGNWFGCDNSTLLWHYPLPDHYVRRNPYSSPPEPRVFVPAGSDPNQLFPTSRVLERFNDPGAAGRTTSACGLGIYRDDLLEKSDEGNAFICEPVHNLVHRLVLRPDGVTFRGARAPDESRSEFLSSRDNWFRPVQARTGPDGAMWIVDMYRFVVEHPRWIPPERLAKLDVRAGDDKGRIYRVVPVGKTLRPIRNLSKLSTGDLVAGLATPNGTERDRVHLEILRRGDRAAAAPLTKLVKSSELPAVRLQALCALDGLSSLAPDVLEATLADPHSAIRRHATRLSERSLAIPHLGAAVLQLVNDADAAVRFQLALSLGEWDDPRAGETLGRLAQSNPEDRWMRAAILSSASRFPVVILRSVLMASTDSPARKDLIDQLIATAVGSRKEKVLDECLALITAQEGKPAEPWQLAALGGLMDALHRGGPDLESFAVPASTAGSSAMAHIQKALAGARRIAQDEAVDEATRIAAIGLLGRGSAQFDADLDLLRTLLAPPTPSRLRTAAVAALGRSRSPKAPELLLAEWPKHSPSLRNSILGILLTREEWIVRLLDAIEKGPVASSELPLANRQRLLKHKNEMIATRAGVLLAGSRSGSRAEVLAKYQGVSDLTGDPGRGEAVFATNCASCHALVGQGYAVGPDLTAFRTKGASDLVLGILDPNAAIEPRFVNYQIETKDGRALSGVVKAESATSLTLVQGGGMEEKILRSDIAEIKASNLSLMPEGLEQNMTPQDLANLIAFVKQSGPQTFGHASPAQAARARAEFVKSGANGLAKIVASAGQLPYAGWLGTLPMPFCRQTDGKSELVWETMPVRMDLRPGESETFRLPAAMGFHSQPAGNFQLLLNGKPRMEFNVSLNNQTWQSEDGRIRMGYTVIETNAEDSCGILQMDVAGSLLEPGKPVRFAVVGSAAGSQRWFGVYVLRATE